MLLSTRTPPGVNPKATWSGLSTVNSGTGADVVNVNDAGGALAVNAQGGADTVNVNGSAQDNILSLGGGIAYTNLKLSKSGYDLVLATSASDSVTLKNWYAGPGQVQFCSPIFPAGAAWTK